MSPYTWVRRGQTIRDCNVCKDVLLIQMQAGPLQERDYTLLTSGGALCEVEINFTGEDFPLPGKP